MKLIEGNLYTVYEPGLGSWLEDYIYVGYNTYRSEHIFRSTDQFNNDWFMYIKNKRIKEEVLEFNTVELRNKKIDSII